MDRFIPQPEADIKRNILWQYENTKAIKGLIERKQAWLDTNFKGFFDRWAKYFFGALAIATDEAQSLAEAEPGDDNYENAQAWNAGLTAWGKILNLPRTYTDGGAEVQISTMLYFTLLKGELLKQHMGSSVPEINRWLKLVFGYFGNAYVVDNENMTIYIIIDFEISESDYNMLVDLNLVPRPAGVGVSLLNRYYDLTLYAEEFDGEYSDRDTLSGDYDEDGQTVEGNPGGILAPYAEI